MDAVTARLGSTGREDDASSLADRLSKAGVPAALRRPEDASLWCYVNVPEWYVRIDGDDKALADAFFGLGGFGPLVAGAYGQGSRLFMPVAPDSPRRTLFAGSEFQHSGPRVLEAAKGTERPLASISLGLGDIRQFLFEYAQRLVKAEGGASGSLLRNLREARAALASDERTPLGPTMPEILGSFRELAVTIMPFELSQNAEATGMAAALAMVVTGRLAGEPSLDLFLSPQTGRPLFPAADPAGLREASLAIPGAPFPLTLVAKGDRVAASLNPAAARRALENPGSASSDDRRSFVRQAWEPAFAASMIIEIIKKNGRPIHFRIRSSRPCKNALRACRR